MLGHCAFYYDMLIFVTWIVAEDEWRLACITYAKTRKPLCQQTIRQRTLPYTSTVARLSACPNCAMMQRVEG